jgi:acyl carrier protein
VNAQLLKRVQGIVADVFNIPEERIQPGSSPDTIEAWDSIHHLNLVLALEQDFGVQFTPEEIEELLSVELVAALVEEKTNGSAISVRQSG